MTPRQRAKLALLHARRLVRPVVTQQCGPYRLRFSVLDDTIGRNLFLTGRWERHLTSVLPFLGLDGMVAVDVGANVGVYSLRLSDAVGPHGEVLAYEPEPVNARWLRYAAQANGERAIAVREVALGAHPGRATLYVDPANLGNHRMVGAAPGSRPITVPVTRLDDELSAAQIDRVGFVKIDVQGGELEVLHGNREVLDRNADVVIQLEVSPTTGADCLALLRELGFDGFEVGTHRFQPILDDAWYRGSRYFGEADVLLARHPARLEEALSRARSDLAAAQRAVLDRR